MTFDRRRSSTETRVLRVVEASAAPLRQRARRLEEELSAARSEIDRLESELRDCEEAVTDLATALGEPVEHMDLVPDSTGTQYRLSTRRPAPPPLEVSRVLALGSRQMGKLPQDAAATARDPSSGATAYVVADGVSRTRVAPDLVRRFASLAASETAAHLAANARRIAAASQREEDVVRGVVSYTLHRTATRCLFEQDTRAAPGEGAGAPERRESGMEGAACVIGGALWVPRAGLIALFALGNITVLARLGRRADAGTRVFGVSGPLDHQMIAARTAADYRSALTVLAGREADWQSLDLHVLSDGARAPQQHGRLDQDADVLRASTPPPDSFEGWAQAALGRRGTGVDFMSQLVDPSPGDDATVLAARWDQADRTDGEPTR